MFCRELYLNISAIKISSNMIALFISGSLTEAGHIDAFENRDREVIGGISAYERGDGLSKLKDKYSDKIFAGFARIEIVPREEKLAELRKKLGDPEEKDIPEMFLQFLEKDLRQFEECEWITYLYNMINKNLKPKVIHFFDGV